MADDVENVFSSQRKPAEFRGLMGFKTKKGKPVPDGVALSALNELMILMREIPLTKIAPVQLATSETVIFTSEGRWTDIKIFMTNNSGGPATFTLSHRIAGASAATLHQLYSGYPLARGETFVIEGLGCDNKDIFSGLSNVNNGVNAALYGRRIIKP